MAYQPKSYRKFVATAATATLVATAFAPFASAHEFKDVETKYNDAVDFLVSKGVTGYTDGTFKTQNNIKRIEAAEILAKALGLNEVKDAPASGFTDVPARAVTLINAFKAAGITTGKTETTFGSNDLITRGELAIWIQKAYELKAKEDASNEFTDVADRYKAAVQALVDAEITQGTTETTFGTTANAKRGDFALFVKRAHDVANAPKAEVVVEAVEVKDATTVVLTLKNAVTKAAFEGANIQGEGTREIGEITVSEDGKTVTLSKVAPAFEDGKEYVVN
ncbi:MAG: S-layer homology domain-containing protein, partial [Bacillus sp. (in: firmicutes)]